MKNTNMHVGLSILSFIYSDTGRLQHAICSGVLWSDPLLYYLKALKSVKMLKCYEQYPIMGEV